MVAIRTIGWNTNQSVISNLNEDEMKALILQIRVDIAGMGDPASPPQNMPTVFKTLSRVLSDPYQGDDVVHHDFIQLLCGIHQDNELHYTINCSGVIGAIHVYVSQAPRQTVNVRVKETPRWKKQGLAGKDFERALFPYKNTGMSHRVHPQQPETLWPALFSKETWKNRVRGTSFCTGNSKPANSLEEIKAKYPNAH